MPAGRVADIGCRAIVPIRLADWPSPAQRPLYSALDCGKVARVFGITMPRWEDSLERCLDELASGPARSALNQRDRNVQKPVALYARPQSFSRFH